MNVSKLNLNVSLHRNNDTFFAIEFPNNYTSAHQLIYGVESFFLIVGVIANVLLFAALLHGRKQIDRNLFAIIINQFFLNLIDIISHLLKVFVGILGFYQTLIKMCLFSAVISVVTLQMLIINLLLIAFDRIIYTIQLEKNVHQADAESLLL